ncbi:CCR4-NOT transcription complex subunit 2-like protein [Sarcoptes scabiei]|uniref:CCR4-NOT transcription complex subunit 2-like protein n=1 Tax=Sarcoptes scabiei TaxID=52283 RepID=A0A132A3Q6_SARSC|nr:CCR4-NOT transcription complex subunit 2-like protein [Sarcoptes scabiei]
MQITKDGLVTNIPSGMMNDQYGIAGLLTSLKQADMNPNLYALMIGFDLPNINMNLNSKEFNYPVPQEYLVFNSIRDKLTTIKLSAFCEDLLFFLFYCFAGENMQAAVGAEL